METVYRPYNFTMADMAFREDLQVHLRNLLKNSQKLKQMYHGILPRVKKVNLGKATKVVASNIKSINKLTVSALKFVGDVTALGQLYQMLGKPYVELVKNYIQIAKDCVGFVKNKHLNYKIKHLKFMGDTPVMLNIGASAFYDEKGKFKHPDSEFNTFVKSTLKHNGILIVNSINGYQKCERVVNKYAKNRVCIVAGNGAFVSVPNGEGGQIVLQDKRIPKDTALKVYNFFNKAENKTLLKNYYMIVETDEENPTIVDIASGSWKSGLSGKFDTGETNLKYALSHAYNIRFMPKVSKAEAQNALNKSGKKLERMDNLNAVYNAYTNDMAKNLLELPQDLLNELDKSAELQLGKNGSLCIVPKGCSKMKSAEMIATALGLPTSQILTFATNCADVCKGLSFSEMQNNFKAQAPKNIFDCFALDDGAIKNAKRVLIDTKHFDSANIYNLKNKVQQCFDAENQRLYNEKVAKERNEMVVANTAKMKQDIAKLKAEIKEVQAKPSTEENQKQIESLSKKIDDAKLEFDNVMTQFDQYAKATPVLQWYKTSDINVKHYTDITRRITDMSKEQLPELQK